MTRFSWVVVDQVKSYRDPRGGSMDWQRMALVAAVAAVTVIFVANKDDVERYLKMRRM
jgi:hypothetical protein